MNDAGKTVLYALLLGGALTTVAIMRGHVDVAAVLACVAFVTAACITIGARIYRKQGKS